MHLWLRSTALRKLTKWQAQFAVVLHVTVGAIAGRQKPQLQADVTVLRHGTWPISRDVFRVVFGSTRHIVLVYNVTQLVINAGKVNFQKYSFVPNKSKTRGLVGNTLQISNVAEHPAPPYAFPMTAANKLSRSNAATRAAHLHKGTDVELGPATSEANAAAGALSTSARYLSHHLLANPWHTHTTAQYERVAATVVCCFCAMSQHSDGLTWLIKLFQSAFRPETQHVRGHKLRP